MRLILKREIPIDKLIDKNEIAIRWADQFIFHSDHLGRINKNSLIPPIWQSPDEIKVWVNNDEGKLRSRIISLLGDTKGNVQLEADELESYNEHIKNHLLWHRYIDEPKAPDFVWTLSKRGWLVKELDGHYNYKKYRRRKLNVLKRQNFMTWCLIIATVLAATMPFVAERYNRTTSIQYLKPPALYPVVNVLIDTGLVKKIGKEKNPIKSNHLPIKSK